jgi:DNA-binding FadR family transcriptional regulator
MNSSTSDAIARTSLHDQLVRHLALRIMRGNPKELGPILTTETVLARHLKVSRNALREALKVLAAKGMVEVRARTGIHIRPDHEWNMLDPGLLQWRCEVGVDQKFARNLCQIRLLLEPWAAEAAASQATDEQIGSLFAAYQTMVESDRTGNFEAYKDADVQFHLIIGRASKNDLLVRINDNISAAMELILELTRHRGETRPTALAQHGAVAEAIRQRDPAAARAAMVELLKLAEQSIYAAIEANRPQTAQSTPASV